MAYIVVYHPKVKTRDIPAVSPPDRAPLRSAIENRLLADPFRYGLPLKRGLKGYRKLRVGDYRIIYYVSGNEIRVVVIGHRKDVYQRTTRRV
ncbi:MAG: type II toxin-antitoxin system RelE/ParE family toxin [Endomicrobiia bacterium]|nr:type II toxin-antitoxin system RelE/ParE family toxin [Endomicrobiia bacterium]